MSLSLYLCLGTFRNSPVHCDVFPAIDFESWKTDTPALQVPEAILIQTLEKGTEGLLQRRREEYALWENSEYDRHKCNKIRRYIKSPGIRNSQFSSME